MFKTTQAPPASNTILDSRIPDYAKYPPMAAVVFAWGVNEDGQLGLDGLEDHPTPKVVDSLLGTQFRGRISGTEPIVTGSRGTLAVGSDGTLWSWGWNARFTLGHGHRYMVEKPQPVEMLEGSNVVQAAIGGWHSICVTDGGQMYAWGGNEYGQCACNIAERDVACPRLILPGVKVKEVAAGGMHSIALTESGEVMMWGERWGDFSLLVQRCPKYLPGVNNIVRIAAGAFHNLALTRDGQVLSWGINDYGQLGIGTTEYKTDPVPVEDLDDDIGEIRAGGWHSLAINKHGEVFTWGRGEYGRLGVGDTSGSAKLRPCQVSGIADHFIIHASCGGTHTLLLSDEGRAFATGRGSFGRLGTSMRDHFSPVEVLLPGGHSKWKVVSLAAGGRHSLCLAIPCRQDRPVPTSMLYNRKYNHPQEEADTPSTGSLADNEDFNENFEYEEETPEGEEGEDLRNYDLNADGESPTAASLTGEWAAAAMRQHLMLQEETAEYEVGEEEEGGTVTGPPGDAEQGNDLPLPDADFDMQSASFRSLPLNALEQLNDEQHQEKEGHQAEATPMMVPAAAANPQADEGSASAPEFSTSTAQGSLSAESG